MDEYSAGDMSDPSAWRIDRSIGGRDGLDGVRPTSGSSLQSSNAQRIWTGYSAGRTAGWWMGVEMVGVVEPLFWREIESLGATEGAAKRESENEYKLEKQRRLAYM